MKMTRTTARSSTNHHLRVDKYEVAQSPAPGYQTANIAGRVYHRKCLKSEEILGGEGDDGWLRSRRTGLGTARLCRHNSGSAGKLPQETSVVRQQNNEYAPERRAGFTSCGPASSGSSGPGGFYGRAHG